MSGGRSVCRVNARPTPKVLAHILEQCGERYASAPWRRTWQRHGRVEKACLHSVRIWTNQNSTDFSTVHLNDHPADLSTENPTILVR
jgi:hypothetical protein